MGNATDFEEMLAHYGHLVPELLRATRPGRTCAIHLTQALAFLGRDGYIGMKDFRGRVIEAMQRHGWVYYGEVTIDKNPQLKAIRTKDRGLLFKTLATDSAHMHMALADYLLQFRKPGENDEPIRAGISEKYGNPDGWITQEEWIRWARPVWYAADFAPDGDGISETDVLNVSQARETDDERHLCLARGSLVLTKARGYVPIQEVLVGDETLTHLGRWRKILAVQNTGERACVTMRGQGVPGLTLTPDHRVWGRAAKGRVWFSTDEAKATPPEWSEAAAMERGYVNFKLPETEPASRDDEAFWWIVGRWLACGHIHKERDSVMISCGHHRWPELETRLGNRAGSRCETGTAVQVRLHDADGSFRSILKTCGEGASGKHLPAVAFTMPSELAQALLSGYLSGDGHYLEERRRWTASSVSKELLLGMAVLAQRVYGAVASVYAGRPPGTATIEGREVNTCQDWIFCFDIPGEGRDKHPFVLPDGAWKKIRSVEPSGWAETWNLRVDEDESYTAEGCIVKNCPLQLGVIERALKLWSNPGDLVCSPFAGIGSEGHEALRLKRRFVGIELKSSYFKSAARNLQAMEFEADQPTLFDLAEA